MDCVNHSGVSATAFCQNCGKALCAGCVRHAAGGQVLCEPCWTAHHSVQTAFGGPYASGGPNPSTAAILGIIPGVGAMYNGQFLKGLIHVFIFAVLVSVAGRHGIFGLFIGAWIIYQSFEAYHVAKARRDGQPLPDPLGLNEITNWLNPGGRAQNQGQPGAGTPQGPVAGAQPGANPNPGGFTGQYQSPYQAPYQEPPWQTTPGAGYPNPGIPPVPPVPPIYWRRKEPIGAVILIALGLLFLMGQMNLFSGHVFEYMWPLALIALGLWLGLRRYQDSQGGSK